MCHVQCASSVEETILRATVMRLCWNMICLRTWTQWNAFNTLCMNDIDAKYSIMSSTVLHHRCLCNSCICCITFLSSLRFWTNEWLIERTNYTFGKTCDVISAMVLTILFDCCFSPAQSAMYVQHIDCECDYLDHSLPHTRSIMARCETIDMHMHTVYGDVMMRRWVRPQVRNLQ